MLYNICTLKKYIILWTSSSPRAKPKMKFSWVWPLYHLLVVIGEFTLKSKNEKEILDIHAITFFCISVGIHRPHVLNHISCSGPTKECGLCGPIFFKKILITIHKFQFCLNLVYYSKATVWKIFLRTKPSL